MIKINGITYDTVSVKDCSQAGVRHLNVVVKGELKEKNNKLIIRYNGEIMTGTKILPHYDQEKETTMFLVYVP